MTINANNGYEQFYKGTEPIKNYGSNEKGKTKLVHYEFNTTDEQGNKIMDKMSREETLQAVREISAKYGDDVIVEFSGDGMAKLLEGRKGYLDRPLSAEEAAAKAAKQAAFDEAVVQMENTHRIVIPNIQTNEKLYRSLEGADEAAIKAANGIIKNYFLPSNVSGMSEDERKAMIAFGMEEAKYLAEKYLDREHGREFLSAMETIAKYGMNGTAAEDGTVHYQIERGLSLAGAVNDMDILKEKAPDLYRKINALNQRIINRKDGEKFAAEFLELKKRAAKVLDASNGNGETNREAATKEYRKWEDKMEKTELPQIFKNAKYTSMQAFFESLQNQSLLSNDWINDSMARFVKWLNE